jgi:hypothetical protein
MTAGLWKGWNKQNNEGGKVKVIKSPTETEIKYSHGDVCEEYYLLSLCRVLWWKLADILGGTYCFHVQDRRIHERNKEHFICLAACSA